MKEEWKEEDLEVMRKPGKGLQPRRRQRNTAAYKTDERTEHQSQQPRLLVVGFEQKNRQPRDRKDQAGQIKNEAIEPAAQRFRRRRQVKLQRLPAATNGQFIYGSLRRGAPPSINQLACAPRLDFERYDLIANAQGRRRAVGVNRPNDRLAIHFIRLPAALTIGKLLRPTLVNVCADNRAHQGEEQNAGDQFQFFRHHSIPTTRCQDAAAEKSRSMPSDSLAYSVCASGVPLRGAMFMLRLARFQARITNSSLVLARIFCRDFGGLQSGKSVCDSNVPGERSINRRARRLCGRPHCAPVRERDSEGG